MADASRPAWWFDPEECKVALPELGLVRRFVLPARLTEAEEQRMLALLEVAFNGGPAWFQLPVDRMDHWRWKVHDFPGPTRTELLERDGAAESPGVPPTTDAIVGMIAERWRPWLMRGVPVTIRDSVDLALDPSLQGRGVQSARRNWQHEHRAFMHSPISLTMNAHPTAVHISRRLGFRAVANSVSIFTMPLSPSALASSPHTRSAPASRTMVALTAPARRRARVLRWLGWHARALRSRARYEAGRSRRPRAWAITTRDAFDERVDALIEEFSLDFDLIYLRDRAYLDWRYADRRSGPFTLRFAEAGGKLLGYAVTRAWSGRSELADLVALPGHPEVAASLIEDAVHLARVARSPAIRAWMPVRHPYAALLRRYGFLEDATPGRLIFGGEAIDARTFLESPGVRVHYVLGDTDAI